jgi:hypothetical protein
MRLLNLSALFISMILLSTGESHGQDFPFIDTLETNKIWDNQLHNAFTDLVVYNDKLYCVFRQATHHNPTEDASIVVLSSSNGIDWEHIQTVTSPDSSLPDIRDPHVVVSQANELMLVAGVTSMDASIYKTYRWISSNGQLWSEPIQIGDDYFWLWDIYIHNDHLYSISYPAGHGRDVHNTLRLYRSVDHTNFSVLMDTLTYDSTLRMTEASISSIASDELVTLIRMDPFISDPNSINNSLFGRSSFPFTEWAWEELDIRIGSPNILKLPNGELLVAARRHLAWNHFTTNLLWLDYQGARLIDILTLPSSGTNGNADNGYPGLVYYNNCAWVSYYSSHADTNQVTNSDIYIAKISVNYGSMGLHTIQKGPEVSILQQNHPNPFNSTTVIPFQVSNESIITIKIYNLTGNLIKTLISKEYYPGKHSVEWDGFGSGGEKVRSGIYFYSIVAGGRDMETKKMVLLE